MKTYTLVLVVIASAFALYYTYSITMDKQSVDAKESAEKAIAEAKSADMLRSSTFSSTDEKIKAMREKAISAITEAQKAIAQAESIIADKKKSVESRNLAHDAKSMADQAIMKAGSVLASNPS